MEDLVGSSNDGETDDVDSKEQCKNLPSRRNHVELIGDDAVGSVRICFDMV